MFMKRSDMINKIIDVIRNVPYMDDGGQQTLWLAHNILDMQEKEGMLPPTITVLKDQYNRSEGTYGFDVNEWEDE